MSGWGVAIAGVLGAAGTVYGSRQAKKAAKGTPTQQELERLMADNLRQTSPMALDLLRKSSLGYDSAEKYWRRIQQGDRGSVLSLLAPAIQQQDQMQRAGALQSLQLGGRGGGSAEGRIGAMDAMQTNRNNQIMQLQTDAPNMLAGLATERANLGSSLLGQQASGTMGLGSMGLQRNATAYGQARDAGSSLFELMKYFAPYMQGWTQSRGSQPSNGSLPNYSNSFGNAMQFSPGTKNPNGWG